MGAGETKRKVGKMINKILIIEDQEGPLEALEHTVGKILPEAQREIAKWYSQAEHMVANGDYDAVLLDNRMPYNDPGCTDRSDFDRFVKTLQNTGYELIPQIKSINPGTIVIGTSSMNKDELRRMPQPDFTMSKMWGDAEKDLVEILGKIKEGGN